MTKTIGIFGLGLIGTSLTKRVLAAGHRAIGYDVSATQQTAFETLGGQAVAKVDVWSADVVLAAVFDTDQLADLIADAPNGSGSTFIATSTCDPDRMPELAQRAEKKDIYLIEAPLSGTSKDLANGDAVFLLGGDAERIAGLAWLWEVLGRAHHHLGDIGNGNRAKLAVNLVLGLNRAALAEGLVFANAIGLDPGEFLTLLQDTAAASAVMPSKGAKMVSRDFSPLGRISQSAKDFNLIIAAAKAFQQDLPFSKTYVEMMELCLQSGKGDLDNAAIIEAVEMSKSRID